jgi:hypothetical protein
MARETMREILRNCYVDEGTRPKIIAPNTVRYSQNDQVRIRLHQTDIIVYSKDGKPCRLYTGGWQTVTTKDRLNRFMPGRGNIFSDRGVWYIARGVPFYEGIELDATTGALVDMAKAARRAAKAGADIAAKKKLIDKFIRQLLALFNVRCRQARPGQKRIWAGQRDRAESQRSGSFAFASSRRLFTRVPDYQRDALGRV